MCVRERGRQAIVHISIFTYQLPGFLVPGILFVNNSSILFFSSCLPAFSCFHGLLKFMQSAVQSKMFGFQADYCNLGNMSRDGVKGSGGCKGTHKHFFSWMSCIVCILQEELVWKDLAVGSGRLGWGCLLLFEWLCTVSIHALDNLHFSPPPALHFNSFHLQWTDCHLSSPNLDKWAWRLSNFCPAGLKTRLN